MWTSYSSNRYTIYVYYRKIENLFVRGSETGRKTSIGRTFLICFARLQINFMLTDKVLI